MNVLPPLALYVHLPWCERKCPYCDFNSYSSGGHIPERQYIEALLNELRGLAECASGRQIQSVFIGGGTPSLFSADAIARLLSAVSGLFAVSAKMEVTLEANPGSAEAGRFADYRRAGVNRLSIGIQSFNDGSLQRLGRIHDRTQALAAYIAARRAGFENINLDLMHGLPGQLSADAITDLKQAIDLEPEHISWYQLTLEPNTQFAANPPALPEEELLAVIQAQGEALLESMGLQRYEVSAFARSGRQGSHNLNYWEFGDYLGIGAGAHAKLSRLSADGELAVSRDWNTRSPNDYLNRKGNNVAATRQLEKHELPLEFMMNALRLVAGVDSGSFQQRTGLALDTIAPALDDLRRRGLLSHQRHRLQTTSLGLRFLNDVLTEFDGPLVSTSR